MILRYILIFIFLWPMSLAAKPVDFKSVNPDLLKTLRKQVPEAFSQNPSLSTLDEALRVLFLSREYETIKLIEKESGEYAIAVAAVKRIKSIKIEGNSQISDSEIKSLVGIQTEDRFDRLKLEDGANKLKERYGQMGYLNAIVEVSFLNTSEGNITINIKMTENQSCRLKNINFITNNVDLQNELKAISKKYLKKAVEQDLVNELSQTLQSYLADNRYLVTTLSQPDIQYNTEKTSAEMTYAIERPFKFVLLFDGISFFNSSEILKSIAVNSANPTGANPAAELAERIKALYQSKGFANVEINFDEQVFAQNFVRRVVFKIKENPRVRIKKIEVVGSLSHKQSFYIDFLEDNSSSLISQGYYNREGLQKGMENLIFELQNLGYLKSRIQSTRVDYSKNREFVTIQVLLDEGPLTIIESVVFKGNTQYSAEQLQNAINLRPTSPLSLKQLEDSLRLLQEYYTSHGYLDMTVVTPNADLVTYSNDNTKASISYEVYEGPQVKVASITVDGNEKTQESVILHEIEFQAGDVLTPQLINDSIYRIQRTGLFSEVSISTLEKGTQISERTIIVHVSERNPGIFTSGIGVNTEFDLTVRGYLGVGYRNLGGTARALTGRVELKRVADLDFMDHKITSGFLEPYLFNSRTRGRINLTRSYNIKKRVAVLNQVIAAEGNELELLLEREFFRHLKVTWNLWTIAYEREFEVYDVGWRPKLEETSQIIATIGPTVELDYRDNPFNPTMGTFTRLNSEYSNPAFGSTDYIHYMRTNGAFTHYQRLGSPRFIWANSVRGGYIKNLDEDTSGKRGVPESRLFFLGGRSTIRGFDQSEIPLHTSLSPADESFHLKTESNFYLVKSEIRFPIYGDFGGVLFYDGGAVNVLGKIIKSRTPFIEEEFDSEYRDAVGIGIRYNTPVGPVSAEYGYKLHRHRDLGESEGRFHLSIGTF